MNKSIIIGLGVIGTILILIIMLAGSAIGFHNQEVRLRNLITNKLSDNKNQMDKMWKTISQTTQVTDEQKKALVEIYSSYAQNRGTGGGTLVKWVKEAIPNVDQTTFRNLQNIITSERDGFAMRQKEILDFKREHDNLLDTFPNNIWAAVLNRQKINVTIVTSSRTEKAFESGADDDVSLRGNNK